MSNTTNTKAIGCAFSDPLFDSVTVTNNVEVSGSLVLDGNTLNGTELGYVDGVTPGTLTASKAIVVDSASAIDVLYPKAIVGGDNSLGITGQTQATTVNGGAVVIAGAASIAGATGNGGAATMAGGASGSTNGTGGATSLTGGLGTGTGAGGAASLTGGAGGSSASGGTAIVTGGAAGGGNNAGGAASVIGGAGAGSAAGGAVASTGGAGGATGAGGAVAVTGGTGGATSGAGGAALLAGGAASGGNSVGGAATLKSGDGHGTGNGGAASLLAGASGAGATGNGGAIAITAGAADSTNGNGGSITVTPGAKNGSGTDGIIRIEGTQARKLTRSTISDGGTITNAQLAGGVLYQDASGGNVTMATDTAANIAAGFPDMAVGDALDLWCSSNHATNTSTLSGGSSVTLVGSGAMTNLGGVFKLILTAATPTFDLVRVG